MLLSFMKYKVSKRLFRMNPLVLDIDPSRTLTVFSSSSQHSSFSHRCLVSRLSYLI